MNAVLLSPGPSLARLDALPACDVSVAVNRAAVKFPATYWAISDYPLIRDWREKVAGKPKLYTKRITWGDIRNRGWFPEALVAEDIAIAVNDWHFYTATAALGLLWWLGAKRVDVYGADWTDEPDYDGHSGKADSRNEERWARERKIWNAMVERLGMTVERHHVDQCIHASD